MSENLVYGRLALGRRIGAFIVDYGIIIILAFIPLFFSSGFGDVDSFFMNFYLIMAVAAGGILFKDVFGRSLGKLIFGIRIAHGDAPDLPVSAGQRILRNIPMFFWPIELIMTFQDPYHRRLGDKWAHTLIAAEVRKKKTPVMLIAVLGGALFFAFVLFGAMNIMRNDSSFDTATAFIQSQEEIVSEVGGIERFGAFPSGSVHYSNGYGTACLRVKVVGEDATVIVEVYLTKEPDGDWVVEKWYW
jgi:uncharacterized RDD family membrane protein YckC